MVPVTYCRQTSAVGFYVFGLFLLNCVGLCCYGNIRFRVVPILNYSCPFSDFENMLVFVIVWASSLWPFWLGQGGVVIWRWDIASYEFSACSWSGPGCYTLSTRKGTWGFFSISIVNLIFGYLLLIWLRKLFSSCQPCFQITQSHLKPTDGTDEPVFKHELETTSLNTF